MGICLCCPVFDLPCVGAGVKGSAVPAPAGLGWGWGWGTRTREACDSDKAQVTYTWLWSDFSDNFAYFPLWMMFVPWHDAGVVTGTFGGESVRSISEILMFQC